MNKFALIIVAVCFLFVGSWAKVNFSEDGTKQADTNNTKGKITGMNKVLVAYFSHSGNTRIIAEQITRVTGADIFEIQPVDDYPDDYQTVVDQAKKEIHSNFKPKLKSNGENIDAYDVIFIGSPNWWSTIAPPVVTFLTSNAMAGKTIIPFMTHEGTAMGHSVSDIKKMCPKSTVLDGLPIRGSSVRKFQEEIVKWLDEIKRKNKIIWK